MALPWNNRKDCILDRELERVLSKISALETAGDCLVEDSDERDFARMWPGLKDAIRSGLVRETSTYFGGVYGCAYHLTTKGKLAIGVVKKPSLLPRFVDWMRSPLR